MSRKLVALITFAVAIVAAISWINIKADREEERRTELLDEYIRNPTEIVTKNIEAKSIQLTDDAVAYLNSVMSDEKEYYTTKTCAELTEGTNLMWTSGDTLLRVRFQYIDQDGATRTLCDNDGNALIAYYAINARGRINIQYIVHFNFTKQLNASDEWRKLDDDTTVYTITTYTTDLSVLERNNIITETQLVQNENTTLVPYKTCTMSSEPTVVSASGTDTTIDIPIKLTSNQIPRRQSVLRIYLQTTDKAGVYQLLELDDYTTQLTYQVENCTPDIQKDFDIGFRTNVQFTIPTELWENKNIQVVVATFQVQETA